MIQGQPNFEKLKLCDIETVETSKPSRLCFATKRMYVLAAEKLFAAEERQKCFLDIGQMSAAETGQVSAVKPRHMIKSETVVWALDHQA